MTTPDKPQWRTEGDTQVCEWRGMRAEVDEPSCSALIIFNDDYFIVIQSVGSVVTKHDAEWIMLLHAERDRLRKRVEVLEEIERRGHRQWMHDRSDDGNLIWVCSICGESSCTPDCPYTRLAELDKETDDDQA